MSNINNALYSQWLETYAKKIAALGMFEDKVPNHVLVNEYEAGQGIMVGRYTPGPEVINFFHAQPN